MSEAAALQTQTAKAVPSQSHALLVQRKCACGGSSSFSGECEGCKSKRLLGKPLQTKLRVNEPGDEYEQEADRVAEQVMRMAEPGKQTDTSTTAAAPLVQRKVNSDSAGIGTAPSAVHDVLSSPGQPLDAATRAFFEPRFGHNFGSVRVHADVKAADSARTINAEAYTAGRDVVFDAGKYTPSTSAGKRLLAHELTHVAQQQGTRAGTTLVPLGNRLQPGQGDAPSALRIQRSGGPSDPESVPGPRYPGKWASDKFLTIEGGVLWRALEEAWNWLDKSPKESLKMLDGIIADEIPKLEYYAELSAGDANLIAAVVGLSSALHEVEAQLQDAATGSDLPRTNFEEPFSKVAQCAEKVDEALPDGHLALADQPGGSENPYQVAAEALVNSYATLRGAYVKADSLANAIYQLIIDSEANIGFVLSVFDMLYSAKYLFGVWADDVAFYLVKSHFTEYDLIRLAGSSNGRDFLYRLQKEVTGGGQTGDETAQIRKLVNALAFQLPDLPFAGEPGASAVASSLAYDPTDEFNPLVEAYRREFPAEKEGVASLDLKMKMRLAIALAEPKLDAEIRDAAKESFTLVNIASLSGTIALLATLHAIPEPTTETLAIALDAFLAAMFFKSDIYPMFQAWAVFNDICSSAETEEELRLAGTQLTHESGGFVFNILLMVFLYNIMKVGKQAGVPALEALYEELKASKATRMPNMRVPLNPSLMLWGTLELSEPGLGTGVELEPGVEQVGMHGGEVPDSGETVPTGGTEGTGKAAADRMAARDKDKPNSMPPPVVARPIYDVRVVGGEGVFHSEGKSPASKDPPPTPSVPLAIAARVPERIPPAEAVAEIGDAPAGGARQSEQDDGTAELSGSGPKSPESGSGSTFVGYVRLDKLILDIAQSSRMSAEEQTRCRELGKTAAKTLDYFNDALRKRIASGYTAVKEEVSKELQEFILNGIADMVVDPAFGLETLERLDKEIRERFPEPKTRPGIRRRETGLVKPALDPDAEATKLNQIIGRLNQDRAAKSARLGPLQSATRSAREAHRQIHGYKADQAPGTIAAFSITANSPGQQPMDLGAGLGKSPEAGGGALPSVPKSRSLPPRFWARDSSGAPMDNDWANHAERDALDEAAKILARSFPGVEPSTIEGTLTMYVENPVCPTCQWGLNNQTGPSSASGPFHQFSLQYQQVEIIIQDPTGTYTIKNGRRIR